MEIKYADGKDEQTSKLKLLVKFASFFLFNFCNLNLPQLFFISIGAVCWDK